MTNSKTIVITIIIKQILNYSLLTVLVLFISCNTQNKTENVNGSVTEQATVHTGATNINISGDNTTTEVVKNIRSIFEDKNGKYWFGTQNLLGVCRYDPSAAMNDGKTFTWFTEKDGLCNNQVRTIQEDKSGNLWFNTGYGVSRFDGRTFTSFATKESLQVSSSSDKEWKIKPDDLWFDGVGGGVYRTNGNLFTNLHLPKTDFDSTYSQSQSNRLNPYGVYCTLKDKKGNMWFGTQAMGVCRYDPSASLRTGGKYFTWLTEKGLAGPAVRGLFEDKNGVFWFGNNGAGLFRYDPVSGLLTNLTQEKGLTNDEFLKASKISSDKPGTLARVSTINEDNNGDLWIGTFDSGVWRYDGKNLTNYTKRDGLTSNVINTIYKDKKGQLWFGTAAGVSIFNGLSFITFVIK